MDDRRQDVLHVGVRNRGHPDKVCDQISDAILDAVLARDPEAHVACETATTTGMVLVFGEISTTTYVDIPAVVRETIEKIGYTSRYGFDAKTCGVIVAIKEQSQRPTASRTPSRSARATRSRFDQVGAGDQGMMIGFACDETPELMPLPISLAHRLCRRLAEARKSGEIPWLLPDGKAQVTVEYHRGKPARIGLVVVSAARERHFERGDRADDNRRVFFIIPGQLLDGRTDLFINPSRRFESAAQWPMPD